MGFEVAYNIAVGLAALERYDQAKEYLNSASVGCNNSLKQAGYSDQEIQEELACIDVQMAYLLQKQSSVDQSRAVYGDILRSKYCLPVYYCVFRIPKHVLFAGEVILPRN